MHHWIDRLLIGGWVDVFEYKDMNDHVNELDE